jgi:hypothetical protein
VNQMQLEVRTSQKVSEFNKTLTGSAIHVSIVLLKSSQNNQFVNINVKKTNSISKIVIWHTVLLSEEC